MSLIKVVFFLSCCHAVKATAYEGFAKGSQPLVPSNDPDLFVQNIWEFDLDERVTMMKFVPGDKRVITTHKNGQIRLYAGIDSDTYTVLLDMTADVFSDGDHGLQSFEFHPEFDTGVTKIFVAYTGEPKVTADLPNNAFIQRPPTWGLAGPEGTGYSWNDVCPCLDCDGLGTNGEGSLCEHPYYIDRIVVDLDAETAAKELTLLNASCGSSTSHGPGHILNVGGDLYFGVGDASQYTKMDVGSEDDGCYEPNKGIGQGSLRAIRDDFFLGKIRRIRAEMIDSEVELANDEVTAPIVTKGVRHPWRMYYKADIDTMYVAEVGFGDAGTSERIFAASNLRADVENYPVQDFGWPCVEGVRNQILGDLTIRDGPLERSFYDYVEENNLDYCAGTYAAAEAYVGQYDAGPEADPNWQAPIFEYRVGEIDENYPTECTEPYACITSVFFYEGTDLPEEYRGKLMFSDYSKQCVWYFDNDPNGFPDTTVRPKLLLSRSGFVDMTTGPDGAVYGVDYVNGRVVRISNIAGQNVADQVVTPVPTSLPTLYMEAKNAQQCYDPRELPELPWTRRPDGAFEATLVMDAAVVQTSKGTMRTFAFNGSIPGPIIRMKPCNTYHLNVVNNLVGWGAADGLMNTFHSSTTTNLHLHGMHVSGLSPGDDVLVVISPGEHHTYIYKIPCDHSSGTHWYHPHHHGSSSLQINGGAGGFLLIESSARESSDIPLSVQKMPEQYIYINDFVPKDLTKISDIAKDQVFFTEIEDFLTLTNGCEQVDMVVETGQWTRVRMLNNGMTFNSVVTILPADPDAEPCAIGLLAKDGVWLADVPRAIPTNTFFFSVASRIDIAIRCPTRGEVHDIVYSHINDPFWEEPVLLGTITAARSDRPVADDLPTWQPCRPAYLMDLTEATLDGGSWSLEVRNSLNGEVFADASTYLSTMTLEQTQQWRVEGTNLHPLHVHVNHFQMGPTTGPQNDWPEVPDWHQPGDWLDTLSTNGNTLVRMKPTDFIGPMVLHCHIISHEDEGIMGIININGNGIDANQFEYLQDFGTCAEVIPASTAYGGTPTTIPGVLQAENYDEGGEGIAYHNINLDLLTAPSMRADEAVEIVTVGKVTAVSSIRDYEWLKYSVDIKKAAGYSATVFLASKDLPQGLQFSLWLDVAECPPIYQTDKLLMRVNAPLYPGSGSLHKFTSVDLPQFMNLPMGEHTILLCFEADMPMYLNGFIFAECGDSVYLCPPLLVDEYLNPLK